MKTPSACFCVAFCLLVDPCHGELRITEFMASNATTAVPGAPQGDFSDWIEIHNAGEDPVNLDGYALTDDLGDLGKWLFPTIQLPAGGYQIVLASDPPPIGEGELPVASFQLSATGEVIALIDPEGEIISSFGNEEEDFPEHRVDVSYGIGSDGELHYFRNPSPGEANGTDIPGFVAPIEINQSRGFYSEPFEVTLSTATEGATILYTTDGRVPSKGSVFTGPIGNLYQEPFTIDTTTTLRVWSYAEGLGDAEVTTYSFFFLEDVKQQADDPDGFPDRWNTTTPDYGMDPEVVNNPAYASELDEAFTSLPTISMVLPVDDFFGASEGIYANPQSEGPAWEKKASMEWIDPSEGGDDFQLDVGFKVQGGASRMPSNSPKHSLSLRFRAVHGNGSLDYPVFPGSRVESFNSLHLRAMYNNSWIHRDAQQRERATMIRDQWMRDSMIALGNETGGQGRYIHLYINGLYWGVYNLHERHDNAHYEAYYGVQRELVDGINGGTANDGTLSAYNAMRTTVNSEDWEQIQEVLNVDQYIDFHLIHRFAGSQDLKNDGNWRAIGGGPNQLPWEFHLWDVERVLEDPNNNGIPIPVADPSNLLNTLDDIEEFRMRFADRIHAALFNDGPLTPEKNIERWTRRADELEKAIVAESARWGDYRRSNPYTRDNEWSAEQTRLIETYFPARNSRAVTNFTSMDLYPNIEAPKYNQHGGDVPEAFELKMTSSSAGGIFATGTFHYTTDGSDPRLEGGAISEAATTYEAPGITLTESSPIHARVRNTFGAWSALTKAFFRVGAVPASAENLAVSELHYHPADPTEDELAAGYTTDSFFEFIELKNRGESALHLGGAMFDQGIEFSFPENTILESGEFLILVANRDAFMMRYLDVSPEKIAGVYNGNLSNSGETIALTDANGSAIVTFTYLDVAPWPDSADGEGYSLVLNDDVQPDAAESWTLSSAVAGSPGEAENTDPGEGFSGNPTADDDGDGYPNFLEYALGSPWEAESETGFPLIEATRNENGELAISFPVNPTASDAEIIPEYSTDLVTWESGDAVLLLDEDTGEQRTYRSAQPIADEVTAFIRVRVEQNP